MGQVEMGKRNKKIAALETKTQEQLNRRKRLQRNKIKVRGPLIEIDVFSIKDAKLVLQV